MNLYKGSCQCGEVSCLIELPQLLSFYSPRFCDCDFCKERSVHYISDPKGALVVRSKQPLEVTKQGSEQADFYLCPSCHDLIAVSHQFEQKLKGAFNASLLADSSVLAEAVVISPKLLEPAEKLERWNLFWMPIAIKNS